MQIVRVEEDRKNPFHVGAVRRFFARLALFFRGWRTTSGEVAERLLTEARVASIPLSPFYAAREALPFVRLCIARRDDTLDEAAARLNAFAARAQRG